MDIVIIGGGLAGYQTAKEIRRTDRHVRLLLISSDSADFYSKPMLSNALASKKTPESLVIKKAHEMAAELDIEILPHSPVEAIFPEKKEISLGNRSIGYSKLVLALGAEPTRLPVEGEVLSVNDLSDYARFREALAGKKRVALLGAGLVGCEFANDLLAGGFDVDVFDIASQPLGRLVPAECGEWIRANLKGVNWHFGANAMRFENGMLHLSDGNALPFDVVLSAAGLKPRTGLAMNAGMACGRGIMVDRFLETSSRDVYAIGDCMEIEGLVQPFVMPIMHASKALASNLLGNRVALRFPAMPVVVKTPLSPTVVSPPRPGSKGAWHAEAEEGGVKSVFLDEGGKILGFCLCGKYVSEKNSLSRALPDLL